jgi:hypothetical protein
MGVLTLTSFDGLGNVIASGELVVDQPFDVPHGQPLLWHIDRQQPKDLFDFTTGVNGSMRWLPNLPSPNGSGGVTPELTLMLVFGNGLNPFAHLFHVGMLDPEDPDSGQLVTAPAGPGWLFRGKRLPSGLIAWSFQE